MRNKKQKRFKNLHPWFEKIFKTNYSSRSCVRLLSDLNLEFYYRKIITKLDKDRSNIENIDYNF